MTTLRNTIAQLASTFASGVLSAIRSASLEEILAESGGGSGVRRGPGRPRLSAALDVSSVGTGRASRGPGRKKGRLGRRSANDIAAVVQSIVALLERKPKGLRAEQIRSELGLDAKELPRPIADALSSRKISKQGQKRATTYFAKGAMKAVAASKTRGAKAAAKGGKAPKKGRKAAGKRGGKGAAGHADSAANGASTAQA